METYRSFGCSKDDRDPSAKGGSGTSTGQRQYVLGDSLDIHSRLFLAGIKVDPITSENNLSVELGSIETGYCSNTAPRS